MRRTRFTARSKLPPETEMLSRLAVGFSESGSRLEDGFWLEQLESLIDRLIADNDEEGINAALDHLYNTNISAYDELIDLVESRSESRRVAAGGREWDALLIVAPVLAWSRFSIPACPLTPAATANLRTHLAAHILAADARLALADQLFSPDQLPQGFCATADLTAQLAALAADNDNLRIDPHDLPETQNFLADTRYLIGVVVAPRGKPIFRWNEADGSREQAQKQWQAQGGACIAPILTGCAFELLLPDAYFSAWRRADRQARPFSLRASVAFLQAVLNVRAEHLRAIVAPYHERQLEEYRIGFTQAGREDVVHGVVWPLLEAEDEQSDSVQQIEATLRESGVTQIAFLDHRFPLEYCDDCGVPLYPNAEGESVHAELPEQVQEQAPKHLH